MPKEVAHWVIAHRVMEELPSGALREAVRRYPNCLRLGAIFHDVGYYSRETEPKPLEALADRLHGARGEDTNEILRRLAPALSRLDTQPWLASFLVGAVTHIVADRHLHPFVYYFTGNYYDSDRQRQRTAAVAHRRLEVLMDLHVASGLTGVRRFSLRRILHELEVPAAELLAGVVEPLDLEGARAVTDSLLEALSFFSRIQWLVRRPLLVKTLGLPLRLSPENRDNLYSLTYFTDLEPASALLARPVEYLNPISGDRRREALDDAVEAIVAASVELCSQLVTGSDLPHGASLEMGLPSAAAADATHFHPYVLAGDRAKIADFEMLRS